MRDLRTLPKGHLHLHLDATTRPATLAELAGAADLPLPKTGDFGGWDPFVDAFIDLVAILRRTPVVARLVEEAVEDAAADGVVALELGLSTSYYADLYGSEDAVVEAAAEAAARAGAKHGVAVGLLLTVNRTGSPEEANQVAALASRWAGRGVWSFGLANDERGFPAGVFAEAFATARDAGLIIAPHAGEFDGPSSVRACLDLGATRIQHGVRSVEDPDLVAELAERGTCLDVCPSSNKLLGVVESLAAHPLPALLAAGVRCSINADDPTLFGPSILAEYELCRETLGLTDDQLAACALDSIEASGAPEHVRRDARASVAAWLAADPALASA
ncbi:adenosine deaminase [Frondihabitans cladoniiphilus]|uniref:adenosine deaminase n=1 Tax=Frondihabitans cladoniiphilus TaxID=715785 RepID=UPI0031E6474F